MLTENYETSGIGDTLVGVRHALVAGPSFSLVASAGLEMPTGDYRLISPTALFDIGVLDPMLQPGSGSWDVLLSAQGSRRVSSKGLDLTGALSYQLNTTNPLEYSFGDDAIASLSLAGPIGSKVRASIGFKWAHRGRSEYRAGAGHVHWRHDRLHDPGPRHFASRPACPSTCSCRCPLYRYVNETQVAPRLSLVVGVARTF